MASPAPQHTVFMTRATRHSNSQIIYAEVSTLPHTKWYTVYIPAEDIRFSDEELINITIQSLRQGQYYVEDTPIKQTRGFFISYPVVSFGSTGNLDMAINLARTRRQEIIDGKICLDREYIFGGEGAREEVIRIPGLR